MRFSKPRKPWLVEFRHNGGRVFRTERFKTHEEALERKAEWDAKFPKCFTCDISYLYGTIHGLMA